MAAIVEEKLRAHLTTNIPQVLSLGAEGWMECYSPLSVMTQWQRRDNHIWERPSAMKWQRMKAAVAKNKPYSENTMISNHKVKLREWKPASKQSKSLQVWFTLLKWSETSGCLGRQESMLRTLSSVKYTQLEVNGMSPRNYLYILLICNNKHVLGEI